MAVQQNNPNLAIDAGEALEPYRLIKHDGTYADGDATADMIGVNQRTTASGDPADVRLLTAGTCKIEANAAVTKGAIVYKDADGKIGTTGTNARVGIALEAASGAGSVIEIVPLVAA